MSSRTLFFIVIFETFNILSSCSAAAAPAKNYRDFWRYSFDLLPFLPYLGIIFILWAMGWVILSIAYKTVKIRSFLIVLILSLAAAGYFWNPYAGVALFALIPLLLLVELIIIWIKKIKLRHLTGFDSLLYNLDRWIVLLCLLAVAVLMAIDQNPNMLVKKIEKGTNVIETKLRDMGDKAVPSLVEGLESKDPKTAAVCARILGGVDGSIPEAPLFKTLKRNDHWYQESPRIEAALTLTKKGSLMTVDHLLEAAFVNVLYVFKSGKEKLCFDRRFYQVCLDGIRTIEDRERQYKAADKAFSRSIREQDPYKASAWGLIGVELGGEQSMEALDRVFNRVYKDAQLMIIDSLKVNTDPASLNLLFRAIKDPSVSVRRQAIKVLKERNEIIAVYKLIDMLEDPNSDVRADANWALINITGENFDFESYSSKKERAKAVKRWRMWWGKKVRE